MPTTNINPVTPWSPLAGAPGAGDLAVAFSACDAGNGNSSASLGNKDFLMLQNTGVGARTITLNAVKDPFGATSSITAYSMPAASFAMIGPIPRLRFIQPSGLDVGKYTYNAEHAEVKALPLNIV